MLNICRMANLTVRLIDNRRNNMFACITSANPVEKGKNPIYCLPYRVRVELHFITRALVYTKPKYFAPFRTKMKSSWTNPRQRLYTRTKIKQRNRQTEDWRLQTFFFAVRNTETDAEREQAA